MLDVVDAEFAFKSDNSHCDEELRQLENRELEPSRRHRLDVVINDGDFLAQNLHGTFSMASKAVVTERHIGIDQGRHNFAIVAVDKGLESVPVVVAAQNYDLQLGRRFQASDVVIELRQQTELWNWMQQTDEPTLPVVDRVVVHVEQMSVHNPHWKQFGIELGQQLQHSVVDVESCVVVLSQPHLFRPGGVIDNIGRQIVDDLQLVTASSTRKRERPLTPVQSRSVREAPSSKSVRRPEDDDVEPCDDDDDHHMDVVEDLPSTVDTTQPSSSDGNVDYRQRKKMSANIFRYFMNADDEQQDDMNIRVQPELQETWRDVISRDPCVKLDDLGDALLHALGGILSGSRSVMASELT